MEKEKIKKGEKRKEDKKFTKGWLPGMMNWSASESRLSMLSLPFVSDHVSKVTVSWILWFIFQNKFFFGGESGKKENLVQVKTGKNPWSECPNLSLTYSQREKPNNHVWHNCHQGQGGAPWCSSPPLPSAQSLFLAMLPLLLPCACQYCPSFAGAILSHFQDASEAGLSQSRWGPAATPSTPQGPASTPCSVWGGIPIAHRACAQLWQETVGYPHKAGRVPSLALFRCLLRGLLSEMALTSDPAADGVAVVLAGSHSSALQPHVLFPLQRG